MVIPYVRDHGAEVMDSISLSLLMTSGKIEINIIHTYTEKTNDCSLEKE